MIITIKLINYNTNMYLSKVCELSRNWKRKVFIEEQISKCVGVLWWFDNSTWDKTLIRNFTCIKFPWHQFQNHSEQIYINIKILQRYKPRSTNLSHNSQTLKTVLQFYEAIQINKNENKKTCTDVKDAPLNIYKKILRHTHLH